MDPDIIFSEIMHGHGLKLYNGQLLKTSSVAKLVICVHYISIYKFVHVHMIINACNNKYLYYFLGRTLNNESMSKYR